MFCVLCELKRHCCTPSKASPPVRGAELQGKLSGLDCGNLNRQIIKEVKCEVQLSRAAAGPLDFNVLLLSEFQNRLKLRLN